MLLASTGWLSVPEQTADDLGGGDDKPKTVERVHLLRRPRISPDVAGLAAVQRAPQRMLRSQPTLGAGGHSRMLWYALY